MSNEITIDAAKAGLQSAINAAEAAARQYVKHLGTSKGTLVAIIRSNKSQWSGGPANPTNILEACIRQEAIEALELIVRREHYGN